MQFLVTVNLQSKRLHQHFVMTSIEKVTNIKIRQNQDMLHFFLDHGKLRCFAQGIFLR
jgi:hypothetical protein